MKTSRSLRQTIIFLLVLLVGLPLTVFAQETTAAPKKFSQEQLDQMLAPIALYPDSLLIQILIASTYPLEVVMADRWIKQNKDLRGDQLNDALDKQPWDASVKALAPFPEVLAMMNEKLDWTPMLGDAFLAQKEEVMATVQNLRQKAYEAGNLKTTEQQKVIVEKEIIVVQPANPQVVYVPAYDPWWVYGSWWWPAYPPFVIYPYWPTVVLSPGIFWFGPGFFVGPVWGSAWGRCDWRNRNIYVNVNRNVNINRRNFNTGNMRLENWNHDPTHRRGVAYRDPISRQQFTQVNRSAVENRRNFRGFEKDLRGSSGNIGRSPDGRTGWPGSVAGRPAAGTGRPGEIAGRPGTVPGRSDEIAGGRHGNLQNRPGEVRGGAAGPGSVPPSPLSQANANRPPVAPQAPTRPDVDRSNNPSAFKGIGRGDEIRSQSNWGSSARSGMHSGGGAPSGGPGGGMMGGPGGGGFRGGPR